MHKISGIVIHGDGYGRKLGFPTANLDKKNTDIKSGVYKGKVETEGKAYRAGILINPTGKVEAHLLEFNDDLYGKIITIEVGDFIREYKNFDSEAELINQIKKDIELC